VSAEVFTVNVSYPLRSLILNRLNRA